MGICRGETPDLSHPAAKQKATCLMLVLASESENNNNIFYSSMKGKVPYPRRGLHEAVQYTPGVTRRAAGGENRAQGHAFVGYLTNPPTRAPGRSG